jgi:hypothetical protein
MILTEYEDFEIGDCFVIWEKEFNNPWRFFGVFHIVDKWNSVTKTFGTVPSCVWLKDSDTPWSDDMEHHWDEVSIRDEFPDRYELFAWKLDEDEVLRHVVMEQL